MSRLAHKLLQCRWIMVAAQEALPTLHVAFQRSWTTCTTPASVRCLHQLGLQRSVRRTFPQLHASRCFSSLPEHTKLNMPALSPTMSKGTIVKWHVKVGDAISPGSVLAEVETDKATLEFENQDDGFIAKLLVAEGAKDIDVGTPVAIVVEQADQIAAFKDYQSEGGKAKPSSQPSQSSSAASASAEKKETSQAADSRWHDRLGPAARYHMHQLGYDINDITPSGPHGMVTRYDVMKARESGVKPQHGGEPAASSASSAQQPPAKSQPAAATSKPPPSQPPQQPSLPPSQQQEDGGYTDIPNTQIRTIIATRLSESKRDTPMLYVSADAQLDAVLSLREGLLKLRNQKVSVNDFVVKAAALALRDVPAANAWWDASAQRMQRFDSIDVCIAVAVPGGLMTPMVKDAADKSLLEIAAEIRELAQRARANKLKPEEFMGGSFTISNLGMYGIDNFAAIINPPQGAIMAVGSGRKDVYLQDDGSPAHRNVMTVTLSSDARVCDEQVSADFLAAFCSHLQYPVEIMG